MTREPGDRTRQWIKVAQALPHEYRSDEEILQWVASRRVGPLVALLEADKKEARDELHGWRRRYPGLFDRAKREHRGEYDWAEWDEDDDGDEDYSLSDREWERRERARDQNAAEYDWVSEQYRRYANVLRDRSRLNERITELDRLEKGNH